MIRLYIKMKSYERRKSNKELSATDAHLDNIKYKVCCPMCDNKECVKGTLGCEAEQWKRKKKNEH